MLRTLTAAILLIASNAAAEPASVTHVVDGDTLYVALYGFELKVRVADLDTPEVEHKAKCEAERIRGDAASAYAKSLLPVGKQVDVLPTGKPEKWNRWLAAIRVDGLDLATELVRRGLGVRYDGRRKPTWCP